MATSGKKQTILIIDDEPVNIKLLAQTLKDDYEIAVATSGSQALERADKQPLPDLILLDVMMPDIDGYSVCKKLKSSPATKEIPIIFITAKTDDKDETRGLEFGAVDYIKKPFNISIVKARTKTHLENKLQRDIIKSLVAKQSEELKEYEREYLKLFARIR